MPIPKAVELLRIDRQHFDSLLDESFDDRAVGNFDCHLQPANVSLGKCEQLLDTARDPLGAVLKLPRRFYEVAGFVHNARAVNPDSPVDTNK